MTKIEKVPWTYKRKCKVTDIKAQTAALTLGLTKSYTAPFYMHIKVIEGRGSKGKSIWLLWNIITFLFMINSFTGSNKIA